MLLLLLVLAVVIAATAACAIIGHCCIRRTWNRRTRIVSARTGHGSEKVGIVIVDHYQRGRDAFVGRRALGSSTGASSNGVTVGRVATGTTTTMAARS